MASDLDQAIRDLIDAAKRVNRLAGSNVQISFHNIDEHAFNAASFIASDITGEDGTPRYGHVTGQKHGYLSRLLHRGDGVLLHLFINTPIRRKAVA